MDHPSLVGGVGNGAQATDCRVTMRSGVEDTRGDRFDGWYLCFASPAGFTMPRTRGQANDKRRPHVARYLQEQGIHDWSGWISRTFVNRKQGVKFCGFVRRTADAALLSVGQLRRSEFMFTRRKPKRAGEHKAAAVHLDNSGCPRHGDV